MAIQESLTNIISIGTASNPVNKIFANYIIGCKNVSYSSPVYSEGPEAETLTGIEVDTVTNAVTSKSNHTCSGTLTVTGAAQVNNTLGVTGTATMAAITASGVITANATISMGSNIKLNAYWLSGDGGNEGIQVSGAGVVSTSGNFSVGGNILLNSNYLSGDGGNEGIKISATGAVTASSTINATGYIYSSSYIESALSITSGSYVQCGAADEFRRGTDLGMTGTIDTAATPSIVVKGGIIISAS